MPIYELRCENGHEYEVLRQRTDKMPEACQVCGAKADRIMSGGAFILLWPADDERSFR